MLKNAHLCNGALTKKVPNHCRAAVKDFCTLFTITLLVLLQWVPHIHAIFTIISTYLPIIAIDPIVHRQTEGITAACVTAFACGEEVFRDEKTIPE